jgi:hypothetical protein
MSTEFNIDHTADRPIGFELVGHAVSHDASHL